MNARTRSREGTLSPSRCVVLTMSTVTEYLSLSLSLSRNKLQTTEPIVCDKIDGAAANYATNVILPITQTRKKSVAALFVYLDLLGLEHLMELHKLVLGTLERRGCFVHKQTRA